MTPAESDTGRPMPLTSHINMVAKAHSYPSAGSSARAYARSTPRANLTDQTRRLPFRNASQSLFLDFLGVSAGSRRRRRGGAYSSHLFGSGRRQAKVPGPACPAKRHAAAPPGFLPPRCSGEGVRHGGSRCGRRADVSASLIRVVSPHPPPLPPIVPQPASLLPHASSPRDPQDARRHGRGRTGADAEAEGGGGGGWSRGGGRLFPGGGVC